MELSKPKRRGKRTLWILTICALAILACTETLISTATKSGISGTTQSSGTQTPQSLSTLSLAQQLASIDDALKQTLTASIAFNAPQEMKLNESTTIELLLNPSVSPEKLGTQVTEPGDVVVGNIEITPRMKAVLKSQDKDAFDIQPLHDDPEQLISGTATTKWSWFVKANKAGAQKLTLVIYRLVRVEGLEDWREVETFSKDIDVKVTFMQRLESFDWKWIIGIIITLVLIPAAWRIIDRQTKKAGLSNSPARRAREGDEDILHAGQNIELHQSQEKNDRDNELEGGKPTSILFLAADPTDASRLRLGEEFREIQEKLKLSQLRETFTLELPQLSLRPQDISQALLDTQPQIVHFSGHGTATGALCFENQSGQIQLVQPEAVAALFEQFSSQVRCVLLNACYSEIQAKAIAQHIEFVVGMNKAIGDNAAIAFAVGFYQALGAGRSIEDAYKLGCVQIRLQSIPEHLTPALIRKEHLYR
jgi:hypothetical protein